MTLALQLDMFAEEASASPIRLFKSCFRVFTSLENQSIEKRGDCTPLPHKPIAVKYLSDKFSTFVNSP